MDSVDSITPRSLAGETCGEAQTDNPAGLRRWLVLHVKPRTEKKAMQRLSRCRGFHYLPLYVKVTRVQRRKVRRELPLFPGYVFSRLNPDERFEMRKTNKIANFIIDPNPRKTIHQLRQIKRILKGEPIIRTAKIFTVGDRVRVTEGPLKNSEGIILRDQGKTSLAINMTILGLSAVVTIDANICEKID